MAELLDLLVEKMVDRMLEKKVLLDLLVSYAPRFESNWIIIQVRREAMSALDKFLSSYSEELAINDPKLASELIVYIFLGTIHGHVLNKESRFDRDSLIRELSTMIRRYLVNPSPKP